VSSEQRVGVASNRLPFTFSRGKQGFERKASPGGLVSAREPVLRKPGIELRDGEEVALAGAPYRIVPVSGLATTFRVGSPDPPTSAVRRLPDVEAVRALLEWIGRRGAGGT
jgi:trehalose-6-phosphate synthase